jgi:sodium:dicarboxylate symporter family protein
MSTTLESTAVKVETRSKKAFYANLWVQVLAAVGLAIVLGYVRPNTAAAMRPPGDAFIRLISMIITLVIFCGGGHCRYGEPQKSRPSRRQGAVVF